jgi:hypothetical protein
VVNASPEACYQSFTSLGGDTGWLFWDWTWSLRGWMDEMVGGVGLRRGRRHATDLRIGEAVDFWRVEALEPNRLLRLRAEMKVPGRAWLECQVKPLKNNQSLLQITASLNPRVSVDLFTGIPFISRMSSYSAEWPGKLQNGRRPRKEINKTR